MYPNHIPLLTTVDANDWASARYNQLQQNAGYQQPAVDPRSQNYYDQNQQNFFSTSACAMPSASASPENAYYNMAYNPYYAAQYQAAQPNEQHFWWQNQFIDPRYFYAYSQAYNQAYGYNYGLNYPPAQQTNRRGRPKRMMAPRKPSSISSSQSSSPVPSISDSTESFSIGMKPQERLNWIRETWSKAASTNEQSTEEDNCSWNSTWQLLAPSVKPLRRPYESSLNH